VPIITGNFPNCTPKKLEPNARHMQYLNPRTRAMLAIVAILLLAGVANALHIARLEASLEPLANAERQEARDHAERTGHPIRALAHSIVAAKDYVLFGGVTGKVTLYVQHQNGTETGHIEAIEFHYRQEADGWRQTDSAMCVSEHCTREGLALIRALDADNTN
jgi:hypothetical protein